MVRQNHIRGSYMDKTTQKIVVFNLLHWYYFVKLSSAILTICQYGGR